MARWHGSLNNLLLGNALRYEHKRRRHATVEIFPAIALAGSRPKALKTRCSTACRLGYEVQETVISCKQQFVLKLFQERSIEWGYYCYLAIASIVTLLKTDMQRREIPTNPNFDTRTRQTRKSLVSLFNPHPDTWGKDLHRAIISGRLFEPIVHLTMPPKMLRVSRALASPDC